jgi:hypothetical protein
VIAVFNSASEKNCRSRNAPNTRCSAISTAFSAAALSRGRRTRAGGNTVNVGSGGGSITIDGLAATDALFFVDTQANVTVTQVSKTEVTIAFADTGQSIDLHFANHAAEVAIIYAYLPRVRARHFSTPARSHFARARDSKGSAPSPPV